MTAEPDPWDEPVTLEETTQGRSEGEPSEVEADAAASTDDVDPWDEPAPSATEAAAEIPPVEPEAAPAEEAPAAEAGAPDGGADEKPKGKSETPAFEGNPALLDEPDPWD
jgi:hypothetical protein